MREVLRTHPLKRVTINALYLQNQTYLPLKDSQTPVVTHPIPVC